MSTGRHTTYNQFQDEGGGSFKERHDDAYHSTARLEIPYNQNRTGNYRQGSNNSDRAYGDGGRSSYQERQHGGSGYGSRSDSRSFRDEDMGYGRGYDRRSGDDYYPKRKFDDHIDEDARGRKRQYQDQDYQRGGGGGGRGDYYGYSKPLNQDRFEGNDRGYYGGRYGDRNSRDKYSDGYGNRSRRFDSHGQRSTVSYEEVDMERVGDGVMHLEVSSNARGKAGSQEDTDDAKAFESEYPFGFVTLLPQEWSDYDEPPPLSPFGDDYLESNKSQNGGEKEDTLETEN